ncbi:FtsK/SpoIIIE domain-containing protein [Dactylosporangium sp. NBC_01737]|uniref:FtsK/SpoIIIE domain-containing protein n=1 Tax=Dactylosporangium sp. NBC_01737 TaxID=2975959 RepID=UPI002E10E510|nr:FtsK/SpoIIIE domain-containing protein [Dactylosporangium sp. NBC_01737]
MDRLAAAHPDPDRRDRTRRADRRRRRGGPHAGPRARRGAPAAAPPRPARHRGVVRAARRRRAAGPVDGAAGVPGPPRRGGPALRHQPPRRRADPRGPAAGRVRAGRRAAARRRCVTCRARPRRDPGRRRWGRATGRAARRGAEPHRPEPQRDRETLGALDPRPGARRADRPRRHGTRRGRPVTVDLRRDGPHGLVAGVGGSGRSWLLRSYLAALAATYPANRLTFVLVDWPAPDATGAEEPAAGAAVSGAAASGPAVSRTIASGAAASGAFASSTVASGTVASGAFASGTFAECVDLPHTVGVFTDTDAHQARRVLVSLNAELRRREAVLRRHSVKDIVEMERKFPAAAPANLLIVVAEFVDAPTDFVPGLRELARRGRHAGVHLLLATAKPHGAVDDDLRAEADLRIALRVEEEADSLEILERPDAAHLSPLLAGRAFVRTVEGGFQAVQVAYGGFRSPAGRRATPTTVTEVRFESGLVDREALDAPVGGDDSAPTDLQRLVEAITAAHREARVPDQHRPWQPPLAATYTLADLAQPGTAGFAAAIGMVDLPNSQSRQVWQLDLDELGHLLVFGPTGAGKSTLLDTVAASFAARFDGTRLRVYRVDGTAVESAEALLATIEKLVVERAALAEHDGARVLVLVDGHDVRLNEALIRLAGGGKAVGVHVVLATEQRSAVPTSLSRLMPGRIVLRSAGRGLVEGTIELQVALSASPGETTHTTPAQRPRQLQLEV